MQPRNLLDGLVSSVGSAIDGVGNAVNSASSAVVSNVSGVLQARPPPAQGVGEHAIVAHPAGASSRASTGEGASVAEQIREDEALARRLSSCEGSSIDYLRGREATMGALPTPQPPQPPQRPQEAPSYPPSYPASGFAGAFGGRPPPFATMPMSTPMLLVEAVVGGSSCELLVDTGAQSSILSAPLMARLGLGGLLDRSTQGIAQGVGAARILGRCGPVGFSSARTPHP